MREISRSVYGPRENPALREYISAVFSYPFFFSSLLCNYYVGRKYWLISWVCQVHLTAVFFLHPHLNAILRMTNSKPIVSGSRDIFMSVCCWVQLRHNQTRTRPMTLGLLVSLSSWSKVFGCNPVVIQIILGTELPFCKTATHYSEHISFMYH